MGMGLGGCVTVLIIGLAIVLGLWLDRTLENTRHIYTLGLILVSVPVNLVALMWVVRFTTTRAKAAREEDAAQEVSLQEDDNSVRS